MENKFKVGDTVLIKAVVTDEDTCPDHVYPYKVMTDSTHWGWVERDKIIDIACIDGSDWELAKKVANMEYPEIEKVFDLGNKKDVFNMMTAQEVREKIEAYERSQIRMGDLVECVGVGYSFKGIYYCESDSHYWILTPNDKAPQKLYKDRWKIRKLEDCKVDISAALKSIKECDKKED